MNLIIRFLTLLEGSEKKQFYLFFFVLVFMTYFMMFSFQPGSTILLGHDIDFHFLRMEALMKALQDGQFPVYIDDEAVEGFGYPTKWFYPDVILIPFALLGNATNIVFAYKVMLIVLSILCGIFMYITVNRIYKSTYVASISAILYTFSFYRIQDLFERAALGETISFTIVPLVFLGLYEIIKGDYRKWYILSIAFSMLLFSHVLSMFLAFITIVLVMLFYYKSFLEEKKRIYYLILSGIITTVVSAYFLFPLVEQMLSNVFYYQINPLFYIKNFMLDPFGLFFGSSLIDFFPNMDKDIFIAGLGVLLTLSICLRLFIREKSAAIRSVDIGVIIGITYALVCLNFFPWDYFPFNKLSIIRFPWRLFEFTSYFFAIAGGYYSYSLFKSKTYRSIVFLFAIVVTMLSIYNESLAHKQKFEVYNPYEFKATIDNIYSQGALEYMPAKVPSIEYIDARKNEITTLYKATQITNYTKKNGVISFDVNIPKEQELIELPLFYYKGYIAQLNGKEITVAESENGLLELSGIDQSGKIEVRYSGTMIQKISPYISIAGILALCVYIFISRRRKKTTVE